MDEVWKPVRGFEKMYEVSSAGRVRSVDRWITYKDGRVGRFPGRLLSAGRGVEGYCHVSTTGLRRALVHRLVAEAFLPQPIGCDVVNHLNGDKRDNRAENLEWGTYQSNNRHARDTGLQQQHGENNNLTKYGNQLVAAARRVHSRYSCSYSELAMLFDISQQQAADIIRGRTRVR